MKKINNKGFMLAEVVIVSAVMVTTLVGLYTGFSNTYKAYEVKSSYYDANTMYALKTLESFLIDELVFNKLVSITNFSNIEISNTNLDEEYHKIFLNNFKNTYNVANVYLLKYDKTIINNFANLKDDEFQKYLEFYIESVEENDEYTFTSNKVYNYVLIAVTNDNTYTALRIK